MLIWEDLKNIYYRGASWFRKKPHSILYLYLICVLVSSVTVYFNYQSACAAAEQNLIIHVLHQDAFGEPETESIHQLVLRWQKEDQKMVVSYCPANTNVRTALVKVEIVPVVHWYKRLIEAQKAFTGREPIFSYINEKMVNRYPNSDEYDPVDLKQFRRDTMAPFNVVYVRGIRKDSGVYMIASESHPLAYTLRQLFLRHVVVLILYIFVRYWMWWRKLSTSEKEKVNTMRRDTMNAIAHEVRTPLAAIIGYAENLKLGVNEEKKEYYEDQILVKSMEISDMIDDILSLAKLEDMDVNMKKEFISMAEITDRLIEDYDESLFVLDYRSEWILEGDPEYISHMLKCLIDNAVKYRTDGIIQITIDEHEWKIHNQSQPIPVDVLKKLYTFHSGNDGRYSFGLYYARKAAKKSRLHVAVMNDKDGVTAMVN